MRNQLAAIELKMVVGELKWLEGSWLDQIYDLPSAAAEGKGRVKGKAIVLQLSTSEGKRFVVCVAPSAAFMSLRKPAVSESPGSFCSLLRHHLGNAKLVSISQLGSERILELIFSPRNRQQLRLVIELFSKGNILLVDEKGVIICAAEHQIWKDRTVRPCFKYSLPPATADFAALGEEQFQKAVLSSEKDSVVKALAVDLGLSGVYAEELCTTAKIDKAKNPSQMSQGEMEKLYSSLRQLLSRKLEPIAILDSSGTAIEAFPFRIAAAAGMKTKAFQSFSQAVEAVMVSRLESSVLSSRESLSSRRIKEMEFAIGQQKATISEMEKAVMENTRAAELIYEHYQDVKQILDDYSRLRKTFTREQMREYFGSNKKIKSIDEKTGTITLELN